MNSRVLPALVRLLESGQHIDKHTAMSVAHCDMRTAQRGLCHLHVERIARITAWRHVGPGMPCPIYCINDGKPDALRPKACTSAEKQRARRADRAIREEENARRRMLRQITNNVINPKRLGIWGL